jgi:hypothetical protein
MASYSAAGSKHATLSGTTVDTVTLTGGYGAVEVLNRGTNTIWITYGARADTVTDPTAAADGTLAVPAGQVVELDANGRGGFTVKLVGNSDDYSVQGVDQ